MLSSQLRQWMTTTTTTSKKNERMNCCSRHMLGFLFLSSIIHSVSAVDLLGGRLQTTNNDIQPILNLALDAAAMRESDDLTEKLGIYKDGANPINGETSSSITLQTLSLRAGSYDDQNPYYDMFRYAFLLLGSDDEGEALGSFDGSPINQYGDTIVNDLFELNIRNIETEAAIIMNLWQAAVNEVFLMLHHCKVGTQKALTLAALDRFMAYYVGEDQVSGSNDRGHLLYVHAEIAAAFFDQDDTEAEVNTKLVTLLSTIQDDVKNDMCSTLDGYKTIRNDVKQLMSLLTIPLVQMMIHHIMNVENEGGSSFVELYALGLLPRVGTCNPDLYQKQLQLSVLHQLRTDSKQEAIDYLQQSFDCLEVTCEDIGQYMGGSVSCSSDAMFPDIYTLAGYEATSSTARPKSYLDRDLLQLEVFMKFNSYGIALDWYEYGWKAPFSLREMARMNVVPIPEDSIYDLYEEYFGVPEFVHEYISTAYDAIPPYQEASAEQIRGVVIGMLKFVTIPLNVAISIENAIVKCGTGEKGPALEYWDQAAMWYVGSMEGPDEAGTEDGGHMLFAASNKLCGDFDTCLDAQAAGGIPTDFSIANDDMMEGFVSGRTLLSAGSCQGAYELVDELMIPALIVNSIQGTVWYAKNNEGLPAGTEDEALAVGYAYSTSLLPLLDDVNEDSAKSVVLAMNFQLTSQPVINGFGAVVDAISIALPDLAWDIDCDDIGTLDFQSDDAFCPAESVTEPQPTPNPPPVPAPTNPQVPAPTNPPVSAPTNPPPVAPPTNPPVPAPTVPTGPAGIAFGRYQFTDLDVVDADASFAFDVKEISTAAGTAQARTVYEQGSGKTSAASVAKFGSLSLQTLSSNANEYMKDDPMYNIYKYSNFEEQYFDNPVDGEDFAYADDIVESMFDSGAPNAYIAEATVVLHTWMTIVHYLYKSVATCNEGPASAIYIDSAVAMWIGHDQAEGKFASGSMMYSIAQTAYARFGFAEKEAPVNTRLMVLMQEAQEIARVCEDNDVSIDTTTTALRRKVQETIRELTKPLVQNLLYYITTPNSDEMVKVYGNAVVPQAETCNPDVARGLKTALYGSGSSGKPLMGQLGTFFQCIRVNCEDIKVAASNSVRQELKDAAHGLCSTLNQKNAFVGYQPDSDASEFARLDIDAQVLQILMTTKAYKAARDVYTFGWNSFQTSPNPQAGKQTLLSLHGVATSNQLEALEHFQSVKKYYGSGNYFDSLLLDAMDVAFFQDALTSQRKKIVFRAVQTMVIYLGVLSKLQAAIQNCRSGDPSQATAQLEWDAAVAMYVGSIEGRISGGNGNGLFMYSLGNEMCANFGTCEGTGEATSNQELMLSFASGRDSVRASECDELKRLVTWDVIPRITLPMVQGVLYYAIENDKLTSGVNQDGVAEGNIIADALLPYIDGINTTSSGILEDNFEFEVNMRPVPDGAAKVFEAMTFVLRKLGIDCNDIGTPVQRQDLSTCKHEIIAPHVDTPTNLGDDMYVTTTYVDDRADIALDIRDMEQSLMEIDNREIARLVYRNGKNSEKYDENGQYAGLRSLRSFSTEASVDMKDEPLFNLFLYSLQDDNGQVLGKEARLYADTIVENTFDLTAGGNSLLPAETALVLNLWMYVAHLLQKTLENCKNKQIRDEDGVHSIDVAVAYWIGDGSFSGDEAGHALYKLTEDNDKSFTHEATGVGGQSGANTKILSLFNSAKNELHIPSACSDNPLTFLRLSQILNQITSVMAIPIIQGLIHNLQINDQDRIYVYATAYVPLVATCSPSKYAYLKNKLLGDTAFNVVEADDIISMIRSTLHCLGLKCDDIGIYESEITEESPNCLDFDALTPLAGYKPSHDVREYALFDLDLLELDIMMKMGAYNAASNIYKYGKHVKNHNDSGGTMSLAHLATTSDRTVVPTFDSFERYYETDSYADDIIQQALNDNGVAWSDEERRAVVVRSSQSMVLYFAALQFVYDSVESCSTQRGAASVAWDRAAAILIGHLEGIKEEGSNEGYMMFDLSQEYCEEFGTCVEGQTMVSVTEQMVSLLYSGRGALQSSCKALRKEANELASLILVPIIQGALSASLRISSSSGNVGVAKAEGYAYSSALLPLIRDADLDAAAVVEDYLGMDASAPNKNAASKVFAAMAKSYTNMGVDCEMVGTAGGFDACTGAGQGKLSKKHIGIIIGASVALLLLCCCGLFFRRRKKQTETLAENNPEFVVKPEGEMNHSMDLLTKAFTDKPVGNNRPPTEMDSLTADAASGDPEQAPVDII